MMGCNRRLKETELKTISRGGSISGQAPSPGIHSCRESRSRWLEGWKGGQKSRELQTRRAKESRKDSSVGRGAWAGSHSRASSQRDLGGVPEGCTKITQTSPLRLGLVLETGVDGWVAGFQL